MGSPIQQMPFHSFASHWCPSLSLSRAPSAGHLVSNEIPNLVEPIALWGVYQFTDASVCVPLNCDTGFDGASTRFVVIA
ncbi:hypothetical protein TNCT_510361 [Trichonephila clavata]|uniref:Uncharacterized protein n=1 Tax=Trichonephila clavata TaxID=2740835 RepID=A0A8X6IRW5_TRICU|nr:hypothetical protein TNCT_510361 [Trichonephila clavata]